MFSFSANANTSIQNSVNPLQKIVKIDKRYAIKLLVHLGRLGEYGIDFEFDWPIAPPKGPFESKIAKFNENGTLTVTFNQKFPVDVLEVDTATIGKQLSKSESLENIVIAPGKYKVVNGNTVTFNLEK